MMVVKMRGLSTAVMLLGCFLFVLMMASSVSSLSSSSSITLTSQDPSTPLQQLPTSFTESWPTWVVECDGSFTPIPSDSSQDKNQAGKGYVNPTSYDELWLPLDLNPPKARLCLGLHIRDGTLRHILPAVDLVLESEEKEQKTFYRNRGMCSVPRSHTWAECALTDDYTDYQLCMERRKAASKNDDNEPAEWELLQSSCQFAIRNALQRVIYKLAEDPPSALASGSHILHVILEDEDAEFVMNNQNDPVAPLRTGETLRVRLTTTIDEEAPPMGLLQVAVSATGAGSESDYLPAAYRSLFGDPSLRRAAFAKFQQKRQTNRKEPSSK